MKIESKQIMINLSHEVKVGELITTLIGVAWTNDKLSFMDIDFTDIENIKYMGTPIKDWMKFRDFHKEMGIDWNEILDKEFKKVFTKENIIELLKNN